MIIRVISDHCVSSDVSVSVSSMAAPPFPLQSGKGAVRSVPLVEATNIRQEVPVEEEPVFLTILGWELTDSAAQLERFGT
jgi:hypothetical protein